MKRESPQKILICVAWPYANGPRHIGHVAGFGVPSDIFARYHRLAGNEVLMVSGTDEHGTPITVQADKEGISPRELADRYNRVIGDDLYNLGLSYDLFTRTTTANHYSVTQDLFKTLYTKGYIVKKSMMGAFSAKTGRTLPDRYIEGTCPHCGYEDARGDQCDHCGKQLDPNELLQPRSKIDGQPPVFKESEHYFLDLPAFIDPLKRWIEDQRHWRQNVRRFSLNLVEDLHPRAITRDLEWGIPIPLAEYAHRDDKKIYGAEDGDPAKTPIGYLFEFDKEQLRYACSRLDKFEVDDAMRELWAGPCPDAGRYVAPGNPRQLLDQMRGGSELAKCELPLEEIFGPALARWKEDEENDPALVFPPPDDDAEPNEPAEKPAKKPAASRAKPKPSSSGESAAKDSKGGKGAKPSTEGATGPATKPAEKKQRKTRTTKPKQEAAPPPEPEAEVFECPDCKKDWPENEPACPNCGAVAEDAPEDFEGEEEKAAAEPADNGKPRKGDIPW